MLLVHVRSDTNNNGFCDVDEGPCRVDTFGQFVSTSGFPVGSEFPVNTDTDQTPARVVFGGGRYFVVFNILLLDPDAGFLAGDVFGILIPAEAQICPHDGTKTIVVRIASHVYQ